MPQDNLIDFSIHYSGPSTATESLDFYDGAESLFGFARALKISTHYFIHGKVIFQAPAAKDAKLFMRPSRPGSFVQDVQLFIENADPLTLFVLTAAGGGFGAAIGEGVRDFVKWIFSKAAGKTISATSKLIKLVGEQYQADLEALAELIHGPLLMAHRPIMEEQDSIALRSGKEILVTYDVETQKYLAEEIAEKDTVDLRVSTAAFNYNNRSGRLFDLAQGRTVPFKIDKKHPPRSLEPLSWSLDQRVKGFPGVIQVTVQRIMTTKDEPKRYILFGCKFVR